MFYQCSPRSYMCWRDFKSWACEIDGRYREKVYSLEHTCESDVFLL